MDRKIRTLPSQPMSATHWRGEVDPSCSVVLQNGHSCRRTCTKTSLLFLYRVYIVPYIRTCTVCVCVCVCVCVLRVSVLVLVCVWMRHCPRQESPTAGAFLSTSLAVSDCFSGSWSQCPCTHSGAHKATCAPIDTTSTHPPTHTHTLHGCGP